MTAKENLLSIYRKTYICFFLIIIIATITALFISFYEISNCTVSPNYEEDFTIKENAIFSPFVKNFVLNNTILILSKNLIFIVVLFCSLCYSFFIGEKDLINSDGLKNNFSQIISRGLYIILFLWVLHYTALDYLLNHSETKIKIIKDSSQIALNLLKKGNISYFKEDYKNALSYYSHYLNIVKKDDVITTRIREINNKIKISEFENNKKLAKEKTKEISIPTNIIKYEDLAKFYFEKKDFVTALYYYKHMLDLGGSAKIEAENKIKEIKEYLVHQEKTKTSEISIKLTEETLEKIYLLKSQADNYFKNKEYQKAYFLYSDILSLDPNLRDIIEKRKETLSKLYEISAEIEELSFAYIYPEKSDILFITNNNEVFNIEKATKFYNDYFLYNIKIYKFNNDYNITEIIVSKYGVIREKNKNKIILYAFSKTNKDEEYFPVIIKNNKEERFQPGYIEMGISFDEIYNFSFEYKKIFFLPLAKLLMLEKIIENKKISYSGLNKYFIQLAFLDKINQLFLFLILSFLTITVAWKLKSKYIEAFPKFLYPFLIIIPFFIFYSVNLIITTSTILIYILLLVFAFNTVTVILITTNSLLLFLSLILLSTNKS